jgi:hypothetical protein
VATFFTSIIGTVVLWALLTWIAAAFFAAHVANTKDRCGLCWFVWGLLFGPFSLIAAAGMAPKAQRVAIVGSALGAEGTSAESVPYRGESGRAFGRAVAGNVKKPGAALAAVVIIAAVVVVYAISRLS